MTIASRMVNGSVSRSFLKSWRLLLGSLLIALVVGPARAEALVQASILNGRLIVMGDGTSNRITLTRVENLPGLVVVLDDEVKVGTFDRFAFNSILIIAAGADDTLVLSTAFGGIREPTQIEGGPGDDIIVGGDGDDTLNGGAGFDRIEWGPARGRDVVNGGDDFDTLVIAGTENPDNVRMTPSETAGRVQLGFNTALVSVDIATIERVEVSGLGGDDDIVAAGDFQPRVEVVFDGGDGDDTLRAANGTDSLFGGNGDDTLEGGPGPDDIVAGPGDDFIIWNAGDGDDDEVLADEGNDALQIFGGDASERIELAREIDTNGNRVRVTHDIDNVKLFFHDLESVVVFAGDGNDIITLDSTLQGVGVGVDAGPGADTVNTTAATTVEVAGGASRDQLRFDALGEPLAVTPTRIVATNGKFAGSATHIQIEDVQFSGLRSALPSIAITSPTAGQTATAVTRFITLAGIAADVEGIESITVLDDRGSTHTATGTTAWIVPNLRLEPGANPFTAIVRDTTGNELRDTVTITVNELAYTMAEGATGGFFDTDLLLANPNSVAAPVSITYLKSDGTTVPQSLTLAPMSRTTIRVDEIPGLQNAEVSSTVTSTPELPIVVERTMRWDATGYGAHTDKATEGPALTWFFAEGAQGFFDTYLLLANPQPMTNAATVSFLIENGAPIVKTFTLTPTSRRTIPINSLPEIAGRSFGLAVTFEHPGVAERAMYFGSPIFNAGHESAGVNLPSPSWFLAEGATGSFFTTFVLLANPGAEEAAATVTFLPESGQPVTKTKIVPANGRVTLNIATEDPSLASSAVATAVQSTRPILVERAQYWPFTPDRWNEAHNAFGSTSVGVDWGLAEGRAGGPEGYQTFILLANADPSRAAEVRITFLRESGPPVVRTVSVNPTSRLNVLAHEVPELANQSFGALIEVTSGPGIFVERALYSNSQGVVFAAGTSALATRLP